MGPIIRIMSRWVASALVTYGIINPEYSLGLDADVSALAGVVIGIVTESHYFLAKRLGWRT